MTFYVQPHVTQFDGSRYAGSNCTPAALANGIAAATAGRYKPTGSTVRSKVARFEEQYPATPGWSTQDAALACKRMEVPFMVLSNTGWARLRAEREQGRGLVLSGDSDRFTDATCSGAFDGSHRIYVHPATLGTRWWVNDPICKAGRWEEERVLLAYASKFDPQIDFGVLTTRVPDLGDTGHRLYVRRGATVRVCRMSVPPTLVSRGKITSYHDDIWSGHDSSAPCGPIRRAAYKGSVIGVVRVTDGAYKNEWVRVGAPYGVTVTDA